MYNPMIVDLKVYPASPLLCFANILSFAPVRFSNEPSSMAARNR
jgi:hypothetical protein